MPWDRFQTIQFWILQGNLVEKFFHKSDLSNHFTRFKLVLRAHCRHYNTSLTFKFINWYVVTPSIWTRNFVLFDSPFSYRKEDHQRIQNLGNSGKRNLNFFLEFQHLIWFFLENFSIFCQKYFFYKKSEFSNKINFTFNKHFTNFTIKLQRNLIF